MRRTKEKAVQQRGAQQNWPNKELECLGYCPVCGSKERELLYRDLEDRIFFCAPGKWKLYSCNDCKTAYLDPRPTQESIGMAYQNYFTHAQESGEKRSVFHHIRSALANGYRNHRFGSAVYPSSRAGILIARIFRSQRQKADAHMRHLPLPTHGSSLLDIGCGNGEFLDRARSAGWEVFGVDPDPIAIEVSLRRGLDVRQGGIDALVSTNKRFDGITLSHVIEHVHDPITMLQACYELLKPGGWIWIETPNIDSQGHMLYGSHWRGLEPPRHLILFNNDSLVFALQKAGFARVENQAWRPLCKKIFATSAAIAEGGNLPNGAHLSIKFRIQTQRAEWVAKKDLRKREFITLKAWKPAD